MQRHRPQSIDPQLARELTQLSSTDKHTVLTYAAMRTRIMAKAGIPVSDDEPNILMNEAIGDTATAVVTWDRELHKELVEHLCNVVHWRTSNELKKAKKRANISLEVADDNAVTLDEGHAATRPDIVVEQTQLVRLVFGHARDRARALDDAHMLVIVDAYAQGIVLPREVMSETGLRRGEFLNARRRLDRVLATAPEELQLSDAPREGLAACCRAITSVTLDRTVRAASIAQAPGRSPSRRSRTRCASRFAPGQRFVHELAAVCSADNHVAEGEQHTEVCR